MTQHKTTATGGEPINRASTAAALPKEWYVLHMADFLNLRGNLYRLYKGLRASGESHAAARARIKKWAGADVDYFK